jgi:hypothetical protein
MISIGNLKLAQLRKLCIMLQSSIIKNLGTFGELEGISFDSQV